MPQPEPLCSRVRPIHMLRALTVAAALVLAGCGSANEPSTAKQPGRDSTASATPSASPSVGACPADAPAVAEASTLATVDLDGDGSPEKVRLTAPDSDCPGVLFAQLGEGLVSAPLPEGGPRAPSAYGVAVPGRTGELLVTRQDHPRGGFQLRVYGASGDGPGQLAELQVDGQPLVPFVATDVQEHPLSIDCADGGLVLTEAVAHRPIGVVAAWDVKQTAYTLDGTTLTAGETREIADNVLPKRLGATYPDLVSHTAFASCRA